jgi:hypothetical protein
MKTSSSHFAPLFLLAQQLEDDGRSQHADNLQERCRREYPIEYAHLAAMPKGNAELASFLAQRSYGALRKLCNFRNRRFCLRVRAQLLYIRSGVFAAHNFLSILCHIDSLNSQAPL